MKQSLHDYWEGIEQVMDDIVNQEWDAFHSWVTSRNRILETIDVESYRVDEIEDFRWLLNTLLEKWLIWVHNHENGTIYYVPENAIWTFKSDISIWSITIGNSDEIMEWTRNFNDILWWRATQRIYDIHVLCNDEYLRFQNTNEVFRYLEKHPECVKISGFNSSSMWLRKLLLGDMSDGHLAVFY
jgi:hypothetical protein